MTPVSVFFSCASRMESVMPGASQSDARTCAGVIAEHSPSRLIASQAGATTDEPGDLVRFHTVGIDVLGVTRIGQLWKYPVDRLGRPAAGVVSASVLSAEDLVA